ncbi:hypothetical protein [Cytobacillus sp. IB215316]|uniref:hypothetical protein n=1 Tax=Cytobacillus sp. IB215316 TaxID=3097354 RepID=UPI002A0F732B|nr:hypothetical protein [Cytobacillus sp. IB215316]MDX8360971.1 hypothetical protein [Cytobacillus sp. IB215316]
MKYVRLCLTSLLVFMLLIPMLTTKANACSCVPSPPVEEAYEQYGAIFSGKVINVSKSKSFLQSHFSDVEVLFEVTSSWKGIEQSQVKIFTAIDSASCGINFSLQQDYLVYAHLDADNKLVSSICSPTKIMGSAQDDIATLNSIQQPTTADNLEQVNLDNPLSNINYVALGILIIISVFILTFIKKKKN